MSHLRLPVPAGPRSNSAWACSNKSVTMVSWAMRSTRPRMGNGWLFQRLQALAQHPQERRARALPIDSTSHFQHDDIAGALPDHVYDGVAQQAWVDPVLYIAVAAAYLQGFQGHVLAALGDVVLAQGCEDAQQAAVFLRAMAVYAFQQGGSLKGQGCAAF